MPYPYPLHTGPARSTTWPIRLVASLIGSALLAGAACNTSTAEPRPEEAERAVHGAYLATVGAGTAKVTVQANLTADVSGRTERAELRGEGAFNFTAKTSRMAMVTPLGITIELRTVGADFYEKAPTQLRRRFPGSREWMRFNFEAADRAQYGGPLYVFGPGADDPWQILGFLPAASAARFIDTQTVRGTKTTHYRATVKLADIAAIGDAQTGPGRRRFQEKVGVDEAPIEAWLDDQGRLRRLRVTVALRLPGAEWTGTTDTVTGTATVTQEFFDFGTEVSVAAPPADETDNLTDLVSTRGLAAVGEIVGII